VRAPAAVRSLAAPPLGVTSAGDGRGGRARACAGRVLRIAARARRLALALLVLYVATYAMRYVVLGRWAWIPMLAASFEQRPWAITLHALGGSLVLAAGLLQLQPAVRRRAPAVHRLVGWLYVAAALLAGSAGIHLAAHAVGGWTTHLGFGVLGAATLGTTAHATRLAVRRELPAHRRWMVRSYALVCAAVTLRLELPLLSAAFGPTLGYQLVSWLCWLPNALWAEWWIRRRA
jgi:uncharacterized membrane protein